MSEAGGQWGSDKLPIRVSPQYIDLAGAVHKRKRVIWREGEIGPNAMTSGKIASVK